MKKILDGKDFPNGVVHGTYLDAWQHIKKSGLHKMKRDHIHLAAGLIGEEGVKSGQYIFKSAKFTLNFRHALQL